MRPLPFLLAFLVSFAALLLFNEYIIYFIVLYQCKWPEKLGDPVRALLIADTHLLGPVRGHWFDKLRREWQMHRSFQTAMTLFRPELVFILGDVFDEGDIVNHQDFMRYVVRFNKLFKTPPETQMYSIMGNHDTGFHYRLHPQLMERFERSFNKTSNTIVTLRGVHFAMINSMTLDQDGCWFCREAENEIRSIARRLRCADDKTRNECTHIKDPLETYSQPILLQHFPTYRESDVTCLEHDAPVIENFREKWEVLSEEATDFLGDNLDPRVAFSGHSHHYCHSINLLGIDEYTIASFSWRNKINPSFLLAEFSTRDHAVSKCDMPNEYPVIISYSVYFLIVSIVALLFLLRFCRKMVVRPKMN